MKWVFRSARAAFAWLGKAYERNFNALVAGVAFAQIVRDGVPGPLSLLFIALCAGIFFINAYVEGSALAKRRLLAFLLLTLTSNLMTVVAVLTLPYVAGIPYGLLWIIGMWLFFVRPFIKFSKQQPARSLLASVNLFLVSLLCGLGSVYMPMRAVNNGFAYRMSHPDVQEQLRKDFDEHGSVEAGFLFQRRHLYDVRPPVDSACSRFLRSTTRSVLRQTELPLHATIAFWIDQFIGGVPFLRDLGGCSLSNYKIKRNLAMPDFWATLIYKLFLEALWFGLVLNILRSVLGHTRTKLRAGAHSD